MAKVDTHGLKMTGLKEASGETVDWDPRSGGYTEVFYDRNTGEVWTVDQVSLGHNSWTEYHDPAVIKIAETEQHMTMQEIADRIAEEVRELDEQRAYLDRNPYDEYRPDDVSKLFPEDPEPTPTPAEAAPHQPVPQNSAPERAEHARQERDDDLII